MPQDRESGARANAYGKETAKRIAKEIGAVSITINSNEFKLDNRKITIRCARYKTQDVGATYKMLGRIDTVIAALEQENGDYELYEISPKKFEENMRKSKSKSAAAGNVGLVKKSIFINEGTLIRVIKGNLIKSSGY